MRKASKLLFLCMVMLVTTFPDATLRASGRKILFDEDWKFHLGIAANAEQPEYNDSRWRVLDLPHDWSVEPLPFQKEGVTVGPFSRMSEGDIDTGQTVVVKAGTERNSPFLEAMPTNALFFIPKECTINPNSGLMVKRLTSMLTVILLIR